MYHHRARLQNSRVDLLRLPSLIDAWIFLSMNIENTPTHRKRAKAPFAHSHTSVYSTSFDAYLLQALFMLNELDFIGNSVSACTHKINDNYASQMTL